MTRKRRSALAGQSLALAALAALVLPVLLFAPSALAAPGSDQFTEALAKGPIYAGLAAFASGVLVSLTPCVYPMIAITVSVFGARQVSSRFEGAALSASFVAGIVAMFVPLGVIAGLSGSLAGAVLQSKWVVLGISGLFLAMAAAMFGAFELDLPEGIKNRLSQLGGTGYLGAFALGLACGPIAAPCTGPFLTGILAWITRTQSATLGAAAMGAFGLGLGLPFFFVGTFAVQLPKSGRWMLHIKSILGLILIVVALFFLNNAFGFLTRFANPSPRFLAVCAAVFVAGLAFGAIHKSFEGGGVDVVRKGLGVALSTVGAVLFVVGVTTPAGSLTWHHMPPKEARVQASAAGQPLIVDFGAAWCTACKELDKVTFARPDVRSEAGRFFAVKVDATNDEDPNVVGAMSEFRVRGLPTVVVFDSRGAEALRYTDFVGPDQFLDAIRKVD